MESELRMNLLPLSQASITKIVWEVLDSNAIESDDIDNDIENKAVTQAKAIRALNVIKNLRAMRELKSFSEIIKI